MHNLPIVAIHGMYAHHLCTDTQSLTEELIVSISVSGIVRHLGSVSTNGSGTERLTPSPISMYDMSLPLHTTPQRPNYRSTAGAKQQHQITQLGITIDR